METYASSEKGTFHTNKEVGKEGGSRNNAFKSPQKLGDLKDASRKPFLQTMSHATSETLKHMESRHIIATIVCPILLTADCWR